MLKKFYAEGVITYISDEDRPDYSKISVYKKDECEQLKECENEGCNEGKSCKGVWQDKTNKKDIKECSEVNCSSNDNDTCCECVVQGPCVWDKGRLYPEENWDKKSGESAGGGKK